MSAWRKASFKAGHAVRATWIRALFLIALFIAIMVISHL